MDVSRAERGGELLARLVAAEQDIGELALSYFVFQCCPQCIRRQ